MTCLNCRNNVSRLTELGLCDDCYTIDKIRNLYTPIEGDDISEEELEVTIQRQLTRLPDWWDNDFDDEDAT